MRRGFDSALSAVSFRTSLALMPTHINKLSLSTHTHTQPEGLMTAHTLRQPGVDLIMTSVVCVCGYTLRPRFFSPVTHNPRGFPRPNYRTLISVQST